MRRRNFGLVAGGAVMAWALALPAAQAAPGDPVPGPPRSEVLAVDPSTVVPPEDVVSAAAVPCPAAGFGARTSAPGSGKTVALTFDDGPGPHTPAMMRVLEDAGVTATFFDVGVNMTVRPDVVRAVHGQGFLLGNHSWSHADLRTLSAAGQAAEMDRQAAQQRALVGDSPCVFRPPYGAYTSTTLNLAQARRMSVWNWSVDTLDWQAPGSGSQVWTDRIVARAQAGGSQTHPVILMHSQVDGSASTLAALPRIIQYYRDRGYTFVDLLGRVADRPVTGDWDGDGRATPGIVRGGTWYLRNSNSSGPADIVLKFGLPSDQVVVGDWNDDGRDTPGVVRGSTWYLRNSNVPADTARQTLTFGTSSYRPVAGDWNGDGTDTPGVVSGGTWHLRSTNAATSSKVVLTFGTAGYRPVTGDWNGDGITTPGMVSGTTWHLRSSNAASSGKLVLTYGASTDRLISGDWDGDGDTTPGVVRGHGWHLRSVNSSGPAQASFTFGP
jgi:peptidoglycan/xylan/chitin deacetylase (PgdA/CDA1 family)